MAVAYKKTLEFFHKTPQTKVKKDPHQRERQCRSPNSKYVFIICVLPSQLSNLH